MSVYIFFKVNEVALILPFTISKLAYEMLDQPIIIFSIWMYIRFGYFFLNLKELQPKVYRAAVRLEIGYASLVALRIILMPFQLTYYQASIVFLLATVILAIMAMQVIIRLLLQKNLLNNFLVSGGLCITLGGIFGPIIATFLPNMGEGNLLVYAGIEVGVFIEMILLNIGFLLKNKILNQQVIKAQAKINKQYQNK